MKLKLPYLIAIFCLLCNHSFAQATYYISTSGDDSTGDGSLGSPWATIQEANDNAADGDTIQIADGTYTESDININKNLTILGTSANNTIIQASASQPAGDGSGASADLDIFKITGGKTVTFRYLTMQHANTTNQSGGAIFSTWNCNVIIEYCNFFHNYATWNIGAVYGDGPSTIIRNSSFAYNNTGGKGGVAGANGSPDTFLMENCTLYDNHSITHGGALYFNNGVTFTLKNNTMVSNSSANDTRHCIYSAGNAIAAEISNNIFLNVAESGVEFGYDGNNPASSAIVKNNIIRQVWISELQNEANSIVGKANATTALLAFGSFDVNLADGIYSLPITTSSIAKNAGDAGTALTTDIHGASRNGTPDIGAYEFDGILSTLTTSELSGISLSPNPSNGAFKIQNLNAKSFELAVYTLNGIKVFATTQTENEVRLPDNIKGLVMIQVKTNDTSRVFKHLIQ